MVGSGSRSGGTPRCFYDEEIEAKLNGLTSLIELLLIVFLGVVVGTIVVCMFLPIFRLNQVVQF